MREQEGRTQIPRSRALDGLRGAAVVGVILFHAGHLKGGYLGVDLFFVLSGFLITRLLLVEMSDTGRIDLKAFWGARFRRLLPPIAVTLAGVAVLSATVLDPTELDRIRGDAIATATYVANWRAVFVDIDYWALFAEPSPLVHTWSLAIEEQFYLVWPLVILGLVTLGEVLAQRRATRGELDRVLDESSGRSADTSIGGVDGVDLPGTTTVSAAEVDRSRLRVLLVALLAGILVSFIISLVVSADGETLRAYYGTDTRAASLLIGAVIAAAAVYRPGWLEVGELNSVLAVVVTLTAWFVVEEGAVFLHRGVLLGLAVASGVIIAEAIQHPEGGVVTRALSVGPLVTLGLLSYGLYLYHWPVFVWLDTDRTGLDGWALTTLRFSVALGLAVVSNWLVEQPIRSHSLHLRSAIGLTAAVAIAALAVVVVAQPRGSLLASGRGGAEVLEQRRASEARGVTAPQDEPRTAASSSPTTADAEARPTSGPGRGESMTPSPSEPPKVMLVGDSVPSYLGDDLAGVPGLPATVINRGQPQCDLGRRTVSATWNDVELTPEIPCQAWFDWWIEELVTIRPDRLVIMPGPMATTNRVLDDGTVLEVCTDAHTGWYSSELTAAVELARYLEVPVSITSVPYFALFNNPEDVDARVDCVNESINQVVAATSVEVIDLARFICPEGRPDTCIEEINGVQLRPDRTHFVGDGAALVGRWLLDEALV